MKSKSLILFAMAVGLLFVLEPMFAHHGTAAYDMTKRSSLKGTVTDFRFINPHVEVYFDVKDDKGNVKSWIADAPSLNVLARAGWNKNTLKPGDEITAVGNCSKNGSATMSLHEIVLSNGQELMIERGFDNSGK